MLNIQTTKKLNDIYSILALLMSSFCITNIQAQDSINTCGDAFWGCIGFESSADTMDKYIAFDTLQAENIWQYGNSEKAIAYQSPETRLIITDSINTYPNNNVSSFDMVFHCQFEDNCGSFTGWSFYLGYVCDTEVGVDGLVIEVSFDDSTFTNIADITEELQIISDLDLDTISSLEQPGISGEVQGLIEIHYNAWMSNDYDIILNPIRFRFTFASDSTDTAQEGIAFSFLGSLSGFLSVEETRIENLFALFPNPVSEEVVLELIETTSFKAVGSIYNAMGVLVQSYPLLEKRNTISLVNLTAGMYFIKVTTDNGYSLKRIIKE